jgi:lipoyl synthase
MSDESLIGNSLMEFGDKSETKRKPAWLRVRAARGTAWHSMMESLAGLNTVCMEANCPNIGECFGRGTATFMILGDICTRICRFCAVNHGCVNPLDKDEPERVAGAVVKLNLKHVVITSVTRDDLPDGGASVFAACIRLIRERKPDTTIEVLTPDFRGDRTALESVMREEPDVFNHNVETVPRLYGIVRPQANYEQSLNVLRNAKVMKPDGLTKSGLMVGLGEEKNEVERVLGDLREAKVDLITIGQYLQPNETLLKVERFVTPDEFEEYAEIARKLGFTGVASAPLVRSSYFADMQAGLTK